MAGEPIEELLVLDISASLASIADLDTALQAVVGTFTAGLTDAFSAFTAVAAAPVDIPITADASQAEAAVSTLDAPQTVPVDADTAPAEGAITALDSTAVSVPVDGDTTTAQSAIGALDNSPVTLEIDADTTAAQDSIDQLGQAATGATGSSSGGGGEGVAGLEGALLGFKAATGAAAGETGGLTEGLTAVGGAGTAAAVGGGLAFTGFLSETIKLAADAQAQNSRFATTFGDVADQVKAINVGGLNISLEDLGKQSGTTNANLEATASRIGQLGQSSGATTPQIVKTTDNLLALGATISVNNPRLGDAADVTDRLTNAFARGGRALAPFGISLSSAQINAEALSETGKTAAADLTLFEKSTAGANLALATFGDTLGQKFTAGAAGAQVQLRALKVQLEETLVAVGTPLLGPAVASLQDFLPVAQAVGVALGQLAAAVLPIVAGLAPALIPVAQVIGLVSDGIKVLTDAIGALSGPQLIGIAAGMGAIAISSGAASTAVFELGLAFDTALGPIGIAVGALALLGAAFGLFHHDAPAATIDLQGFTVALLDSTIAAQDLAGATAPLGQALDDQLSKILETGKAGQQAALAAQTQGLSYADLTKQLLGSDDAFGAFIANQISLIKGSKDEIEAQNNLVTALQSTRAGLIANAEAALRNAVAQGTLTDKQIAAVTAQTGISEAGGGAIAIYEKLKPTIDAAAAAQEAQAISSANQSGALAQLRTELASGASTADAATTSLTKLGLSSADASKFITGVEKAVNSFVQTALQALPSASGDVDTFEKTVSTAFDKVQKDVHDKTGNVKADLLSLKAALDPASFIKNLFADAATITQFTANLKKLGEEGFTGLVSVLAEKGPQAGGNLAAGLASDENKAKFAEAGIAAATAATNSLQGELQRQAPGLITQSTLLGGGLETSIVGGFGTPDLATPISKSIADAGKAITVATPNAVALTEAAAGLITERFRGQLDLPGATTTQTAAAGAALQSGAGALADPAGKAGTDTTTAYAGGLGLDKATFASVSAAENILRTEVGIVGTSSALGFATGVAFDTGIIQGINSLQFAVSLAAQATALAAAAAAKNALGVKSPSTVGIEIGQQFNAGIVIGLQNLGAVTKSAAAIGTAISGAVHPAIPNIQIPSNLVVAGQSSANPTPQVLSLDLTIHQTDGTVQTIPNVQIPVPPARSRLAQRVRAEVTAG